MKIGSVGTGAILMTQIDLPTAVAQEPAADPAAIYHGSESYSSGSPFNKTGIRLYAELLYSQKEWDEYMQVPPNSMSNIGQPSGDLRRAYDAALARLSPELREKDWSFSVADGELVFKAAGDPLSDDELTALREAFREAGVEVAANAVANVIVKAIEDDRYWMYRHLGSGIGTYNVSKENFADIVNLRTYMEDYREGGRYDPHLRNPTDYAQGYAAGHHQIMEQIAANAKQIDVPRRKVFV